MAQTRKDRDDAARKAPAPAPAAPEDTAPPVIESAEGIADPAPAPELDEASGAIVEPEIVQDVDVEHESVDNNPRAGTTAEQNAIDFNDANRRKPNDPDFVGMGLDPTPYGKAASTPDDAETKGGK